MKPPVLQKSWHNRVFLDPDGRTPIVESFLLHASDPRHRRALYVRFNLTHTGDERFGEVQAIYCDAERGITRIARQRVAPERLEIDPERAGVGMGDCSLQEAASQGLVRGSEFALAWNFTFTDGAPPYLGLPAEFMYRSTAVQPKACTPHPAGRLRGRLEIWDGLQRRAPVARIDLAGWHVAQAHRWGQGLPLRAAWVHCDSFVGAGPDTYLAAAMCPMSIAGLWRPEPLFAALVVEGEAYRFDGWRQLVAPGIAGRASAGEWRFALRGPRGTLQAHLHAQPEHTFTLPQVGPRGGRATASVCPLAELSVELLPAAGRSRTLRSTSASYERLVALGNEAPEAGGASGPARAA